MLDNSVDLQKDLQLTVGVALTPDQVKALKSDVIWYEYDVVNGEKVLVPKVYLSQATLATIEVDGRNKIGGLELTVINADELRNNGQLIGNGGVTYVNAGKVYNVTSTNELAEIKGNNVTVIATAGNIENIGGRIKGIESVVLSAENGDIINSSQKITGTNAGGQHESILSAGSIESEGTTYIEGKNYISEAGIVTGKNTIIDAKENITIGSLTLKGNDRSGNDTGDNYATYESVKKAGSEVSGTDSVILNAGNNINVKGSMIGSDGTVQLTAENINILNEKESVKKESKSTDNGFMSSHEREEKSYQEGAVGSTIVGNNVILDAKNDINIRASNVIALKDTENMGGNIIATAGNNINILAETLDNSYSLKEKSSGFSTNFSASGGSLTAGVSYGTNSLEQTRNGTTVAVSTLISEGSTVLDAGNRIKTEAMQANIGENLIIRGVNGVELLDAKETYEEKVKQKSTSVGVSVSAAFTPAQMVSTVNDIAGNVKDYGFGNTSQTINTLGNGFQDLRNVTQLGGNLYDGIRAGSQYLNGNMNAGAVTDAKGKALTNLVSANVSLNYSQSSYESNTSGTTSVAGVINVGGNMIVQSEGDVKFVNQKITVGENLVIDAKNFEALAGVNTYKNDTKSSSTGANVGYDLVNNNMTGGLNISGGNSNTTSKSYDNTVINAGGTFQLTTKEDATFAGANVKADKINFDIGKNLNIISLQDEYKSDGKSYGIGMDVSGEIPGTKAETGKPIPSFNANYSENSENSKWVNNQTSIIAENGGSIKVGETLTNIGAIVGSLSEDNKLGIEAKKVVIVNLEDYNKGENKGAGVSGISPETLVPQTSVQYGSHDKEQNTNATFVNTEVTENGVKLDLEKLGINTDITKAQVVTKDEVVEQIDTVLHTDMGNKTVRDQFTEDLLKTGALIPEVVQGIKEGLSNPGETVLGQMANNMGERSDEIKAFIEGRDKKLEKELEKFKNEDGKIKPDEEVQKIISDNLRKTLDEFGKGDYDIIFVVGDPKYPVSIDDKNGVMYVNIAGDGFGNPEEMRKNVQHEGGHGTYKDRETDETSASRLGSIEEERTQSKALIDASTIEQLKDGTEAYNKAIENGDVQNLFLDKIYDKKNSTEYKQAQSTLTKVCQSNVDCLANLYGFSEKEAYQKNADNNFTLFGLNALEDTIIALIPAGGVIVNGVKVTATQVVGGVKFIADGYAAKTSIDSREVVYPLIVAIIENSRKEKAFRDFQMSRDIISGLIDKNNNVNIKELETFNKVRKNKGLATFTEKQIKDMKWRVSNYEKTENPDYFIKPRKIEPILKLK